MLNTKAALRRIKFWWLLLWAYFKRYKIWATALIALTLIIGFLTYKLFINLNHSNTLSIGYVGTFTVENIPTSLLSLATEPLIAADISGRPVPRLASHWTVSDDGKTYIVFLKDNLHWHDTTNLEAKDLSIAISGVQITALNNKAIEFKLPNPIPSFPLLLDKPVFKAKTFYGTGIYRITGIDKIENFVKKIRLTPKNKNFPNVVIKFYATEEQAINALKIGDTKRVTVANAAHLENWPNLNVEKIPENNEIVTIFYNTQDPNLISKEFRQALSYGINYAEFDGIAATGPISPASWAYALSLKHYEYNTGKAKELLSKAQIKDPKIVLSVTADLENVAKKIKNDWENLGVKTEIKIEEKVPENFQALLAINELDADPDQYALWHSTQQETNITKLKDAKVDKLLEDGRLMQKEEKRKELYENFQKVLIEQAPASFLYHPYKYKITYKNSQNLFSRLPSSEF